MDNGVPPEERRTTGERRATARPGADRRTAPARKSAARPRKSAASPTVSVADRIDPLMGSQTTDVVDPAPVPGATKNSTRQRQTGQRKRPPPADQPANGEVVESIAESRVDTPVPYVLPKIVPGEIEPETTPEITPSEAQEEKSTSTKRAFKPQLLRLTKKLTGSAEKLTRSLKPVTLRRHRPRVRRVTRVVRHIDTWSVFKIALLFNIFLYAVCLTAGVMLWRVALNTGTIENIERFFESFGWQTFELKGGEIFHNAWIAGLFGVVGLTGLAVLAATIFNLLTDLVGGIRVTVLEEEVTAREPHVVSWPRLMRPGTPPRDQPHVEPRPEPAND